ncbi:protein BRANCHLESS TRICHOME [Dorcoceras hygrometricum]|uniref:Protein BRANCHLESS TRICHOME n=1 Tax=Dorcoceras hygrometricum TaxID=472368 RepID=A0A2Z7AKU9_9LAMI|nr:protein BRANCHLESS TRICHOME [Dorcoceras hygrometricum]
MLMEEMVMVMMKIRSHETSSTSLHQHDNNHARFPVKSSSSCPTWKLYENPFYISQQNQTLLHQEHGSTDKKQIHRLHLPISARKIAASFWDLTFIKPFMESELEMAKAQINELKAELDCERKERRKMESLNKRLAKELSGEKKGREALERVCAELAKEISSDKGEITRLKKGIEQERKMLRVAEVIREERVQMKLAEAKILLEEKFTELEVAKKMGADPSLSSSFEAKQEEGTDNQETRAQTMAVVQKRSSPEPENPHIRRGIKGFVEFPRMVRAIGCTSSKNLSNKLEYQKAQLKILLKQKEPVRFNGVIAR